MRVRAAAGRIAGGSFMVALASCGASSSPKGHDVQGWETSHGRQGLIVSPDSRHVYTLGNTYDAVVSAYES
ncbi:MAG: hypothetical protein U0169_15685 [Polyangiaceae bacterium]